MSHRAIAEACGISAASVTRILQGGIQRKRDRPQRVGRPRKLTARQQRLLLRNLLILREDNPGFTLKDLMDQSGVSRGDVSDHTVSRFLKRNGYFYLQARKKGLLTKNDLVQRVRLAKRMQAGYDRIWRKRAEGLSFGCTAKGQKEGTGGKLVKLFVAISYDEGVILCEPYEHLTGAYFASLIEKHFNTMFVKANKNGSRLWIQDNDPSQTSRIAKNAMKTCNCDLSLIDLPCRSPDLNPAEKFFHLVRCGLKKDALTRNLRKETFEEFKLRIIQTIYSIPVEVINKTIA